MVSEGSWEGPPGKGTDRHLILLYTLSPGIPTAQPSKISPKTLEDFVRRLEAKASIAEIAEEAEERHPFAHQVDFGQQVFYRKACVAWEDLTWMVGGAQRQRFD